MPSIKRWFPVSHDINSDPEVIELTDRFGLAGLKVWLEILSIADRNDGVFSQDWESTIRALSVKCNSTQTRVRLMCDLMMTRSWVSRDLPAKVLNYGKYHRSREPRSQKLTRDPTEPNQTEPLKNQPAPQNGHPAPGKIDPDIKAAADPIYNSDPQKFVRLIVWIKEKEKRDYPKELIIASLKSFWSQAQKSKITDWWPYIEKIFTKEYGRWNETMAQTHKAQDQKFVKDLIKGIAK